MLTNGIRHELHGNQRQLNRSHELIWNESWNTGWPNPAIGVILQSAMINTYMPLRPFGEVVRLRYINLEGSTR